MRLKSTLVADQDPYFKGDKKKKEKENLRILFKWIIKNIVGGATVPYYCRTNIIK